MTSLITTAAVKLMMVLVILIETPTTDATASPLMTMTSNPNTMPTVPCPMVESMLPEKGPRAGGTRITMMGHNLLSVTHWIIDVPGNNETIVNTTDDTMLVVTSEPYAGNLSLPATFNVRLLVTPSMCNDVVGNFTYRENTSDVDSMESSISTILDGGIEHTIIGINLDSTMTPKFIVETFYQNDKVDDGLNSATDCDVMNNTMMICSTPNLTLPVYQALGYHDNQTIEYGLPLDGMDFRFDVQLKFDGITFDMSSVKLYVFQHPYLQPLKPLEPYYSNVGNATITITGRFLTNHGFDVNDVTVQIGTDEMPDGNNMCSDITLTETEITCRPPPISSQTVKYPPDIGYDPTTPNVTVMIGRGFMFSANQIQYMLEEPFSVIMMVMIAILALVIIVALVFAAVTILHIGSQHPGISDKPSYNTLHADDAEKGNSNGKSRNSDQLFDNVAFEKPAGDTAAEVKLERYESVQL